MFSVPTPAVAGRRLIFSNMIFLNMNANRDNFGYEY
jgi:hypothetical protein